jgi:hypothetical protein
MKKSYFLLILGLLTSCVFGQVNTEKMRGHLLGADSPHKLGIKMGGFAGNTDVFTVKGDYQYQFSLEDFSGFLVFSLDKGTKNGQAFINKGFTHYRHLVALENDLVFEAFVQKEFDEFILLADRFLYGAGLRTKIMSAESKRFGQNDIFIGVGLMQEYEEFTRLADDTSIFRSTNYVTWKWDPVSKLAIDVTAYYQVSFEDYEDFRLLMNMEMSVEILAEIKYVTTLNARYDNQPVDTVRKYDLEMTTGIAWEF